MSRFLVHQLALNGLWLTCVFGALWGMPWLGPAVALPWLVGFVSRQASARSAVVLLSAAAAFGIAADQVLIRIGGLEYQGVSDGALFGPPWTVALWMVFATTVSVSLGWLRGHIGATAALGIVGGLGAYAGGRRLGVASFDWADPATLLALVVVWGVGVPFLLHAPDLLAALRPDPAHSEGHPAPIRRVGRGRDLMVLAGKRILSACRDRSRSPRSLATAESRRHG